MINSKLFLGAVLVSLALLVPFEYYFRVVEEWPRGYDLESLNEWADERAKVESLGSEDIVILGSSRAHFDINIALWDSLTGVRPHQLAYPGSSPYLPLQDLIEETDFNGTLILGVSPGLFFTTEGSWGANRGKAFVDKYHDRTYADLLNHRIYERINPRFSYLQDQLSIEALIDRMQLPNRDSVRAPDIWPPMVKMSHDRNIRMLPIMETDTVIQRRQKDIWFNPDPKNRIVDKVDAVMAHYTGLLKQLQERGGRVVLIRPPVEGYYAEIEPKLYPRPEYWDRLVRECGCKSFHFADYEETQNLELPEWSHLSRSAADVYTRFLIEHINSEE